LHNLGKEFLIMSDENSFGGPNRYYAANNRQWWKGDSEEEKRMRLLLEKCQEGLQKQIELTCKQWNQVIREHIKNEMALRLTVGDERQAVPVQVVDGLPSPFVKFIQELRKDQIWDFIFNRPLLLETEKGVDIILKNYDSIRDWNGLKEAIIKKEELYHVLLFINALNKEIEKLELYEKIANIRQDILGAYFFNIPEIQIYWMVIGIISKIINADAKDLAVVVLIHELAHAYTHLGRDIDGEQWRTKAFSDTDINIVEGLAQFYTSVICEKISDKNPNIKNAYKKLLKAQKGPYRVHEKWNVNGEKSGEIVRYGLIECRSKSITQYSEFEQKLEEIRNRIGRRINSFQAILF